MQRQIAVQGSGLVIENVNVATSQVIVGQLHDVIKIFARPADVQNVYEPGMRPRDRFKGGHALKLSLKRALTFERAAINNFHRPQRTGQTARQPDFSISAATDHAQNFVVGNNWNSGGNFVGNERDFTQAT